MIGFIFGFVIGGTAGIAVGLFLGAVLVAGRDRSGTWKDLTDTDAPHFGWYRCSECGADSQRASMYCPSCGADMKIKVRKR